MKRLRQKQPRLKLDPEAYKALRNQVLERDGWRCQNCGSSKDLHVHHVKARSKLGHDESRNLITLCVVCHRRQHGSLQKEKRSDGHASVSLSAELRVP
jgi:5-methylcytosine-specific restriction endonuclease McrA